MIAVNLFFLNMPIKPLKSKHEAMFFNNSKYITITLLQNYLFSSIFICAKWLKSMVLSFGKMGFYINYEGCKCNGFYKYFSNFCSFILTMRDVNQTVEVECRVPKRVLY